MSSKPIVIQPPSSGGGGGSPGGANTQVQFNDGGSFGGTSGFTFNKSNSTSTVAGGLAIGGATLGSNDTLAVSLPFTGGTPGVLINGNAAASVQTGHYGIQLVGKDDNIVALTIDAYGSGSNGFDPGVINVRPVINFRSARGTGVAPTQTLLGDELGRISARGNNNSSGFGGANVGISFLAAENFTPNNGGSYITFNTTPLGGADLGGSTVQPPIGSAVAPSGAFIVGGQEPKATLTASIASGVLTVTAVTGTLAVGQKITAAGVLDYTYISSFGTGTGGTGTYNLGGYSQTVSSQAMTASIFFATNPVNDTGVGTGNFQNGIKCASIKLGSAASITSIDGSSIINTAGVLSAVGSGSPSGSAGGALAGTYPNPTIAPTVATTAHGIVIAASSVTAASHTGDTNETVLATITVPAIPAGARLRLTTDCSFIGTAGTKPIKVYYGATGSGVSGTAYINAAIAAASLSARVKTQINNRTTATQYGLGNSALGDQASAVATTTSSVTTTVATAITITGQVSNAADTFTLEGYVLEIILP